MSDPTPTTPLAPTAPGDPLHLTPGQEATPTLAYYDAAGQPTNPPEGTTVEWMVVYDEAGPTPELDIDPATGVLTANRVTNGTTGTVYATVRFPDGNSIEASSAVILDGPAPRHGPASAAIGWSEPAAGAPITDPSSVVLPNLPPPPADPQPVTVHTDSPHGFS